MKAEELSPGSNRTLTKIYIITGEYDKAIDNLKKLVNIPGNDVTLWSLKLDPRYDPLREDPKFKELIR